MGNNVKIQILKNKLKEYNSSFKFLENKLKEYEILKDERQIEKTKELRGIFADKIIHYTAELYREEHGEEINFSNLNEDTQNMFKEIDKSLKQFEESLKKLNNILERRCS